MRRFLVLAGMVTAAALATSASAQTPDGGSENAQTVWQGVYTPQQAARGQSEYTTHCGSCHRDDLGAYDGVLKGSRFMEKYREAPLALLFEKIKTTMPRGAAGTLTDQSYVDIVSYVLKANDFPAGTSELTTGALSEVRLVSKSGPEPVPDFALVQVVGCLTRRAADSAWVVTNASEPVRAGHPQPDADEIEMSRATALGASSFRLLVSPAQSPEAHERHKVEVRGFLIRRAGDHRINLTSLETVGADCLP